MVHARRERLQILLLHLRPQLAELVRLVDAAEHVLDERHEDVETVQALVGVDRQVERDDRQLVRLRQPERLVEVADEVGQLLVLEELRRVRVVLLPDHVEHVEVVLRHADLLLLVRLVEVLEDDGDVHVDDDEEGDEDEGDHEEDGDAAAAAVAVRRLQLRAVRMRPVVAVALRAAHHERVEDVVPAGGRRQAEQQHEAAAERLEVDDVVERARVTHVTERRHAEDGVDEDDEEEEHADVEESGQRDDEGKEQLAQAFRCLDETQHAANAEDAHDTQQSGRDDHRRQEVVQHNACNTARSSLSQAVNKTGRKYRDKICVDRITSITCTHLI